MLIIMFRFNSSRNFEFFIPLSLLDNCEIVRKVGRKDKLSYLKIFESNSLSSNCEKTSVNVKRAGNRWMLHL